MPKARIVPASALRRAHARLRHQRQCSGVTGLYVAAQTGSGDPLIGEPLTLSAIAAAVLGGVGFLGGQGTMRGALAGSLLMSILINVMFFMDLPLVAQYVVQGLIIVERSRCP